MSSVNWKEIFNANAIAVTDFASGNLSFKNFKRAIRDKTARQELNKLESGYTADERRRLARRACSRRSLVLN